MSKNWSKEDRNNFKKSEVMTELEDIVLKTLKRADILVSKINKDANLDAMKQKVDETKTSVTELNNSINNLQTNLADDGDSAEEDVELRSEVLDDLDTLKESAIKEKNYKLAYRIERAIDEILEESVACE
tara:strand:- start:430 stop:819 length:390 start_codon:yes stop_codon:yes gene_type:complete